MLKSITLSALALLGYMSVSAQAFQWGKQYTSVPEYHDVLEKDNYLYTCGDAVMLSKSDVNGNILWTKTISKSLNGTYIKDDGNGNIIVAGSFNGNQTVSTVSGNVTLQTYIGDLFVAKLDTSGKILWITQTKSKDYIGPKGCQTDADGNIYLAAHFTKGVGIGTDSFTSRGDFDVLIAKYHSDGSFAWATQVGGSGADDIAAICFTPSRKLVVAGQYYNDIKYGSIAGTKTSGLTGFIGEVNPVSGAFEVIKSNTALIYEFLIPNNYDGYDANVIFSNSLMVGSQVLRSPGTGSAIVRADSAFNLNSGFQISLVPQFMVANSNGTVTLGGSFYNSMTIDPKITYNSFGESDIYLVSYSYFGKLLWSLQAGGGNIDELSCMKGSSDGKSIYISGSVQSGPARFGTVIIRGDLSGSGFLLKMTDPVSSVDNELAPEMNINVFPVPVQDILHVQIPNNGSAETNLGLFDLQGKLLQTMQVAPGDNKVSVASLNPGMYVLKMSDGNSYKTCKILKD